MACIVLHQTGSVGAGSDHLQLIKFWRSCTPERGLHRVENFWLHVTMASVQCLHLSERFFVVILLIVLVMLSVPVQVIGKALSHKWPEFVDADVKPYSLTHSLDILYKIWLEKSAQRDANTAHALAVVVRFGYRPPAGCHKPTDRTDYNTLCRS